MLRQGALSYLSIVRPGVYEILAQVLKVADEMGCAHLEMGPL